MKQKVKRVFLVGKTHKLLFKKGNGLIRKKNVWPRPGNSILQKDIKIVVVKIETPSSPLTLKSPLPKARRRNPSSESRQRNSSLEPRHRNPSSESRHRNPSSEPRQRNPSSEPRHRNPSSEPRHRNPSSEPRHRNPSSEPRHRKLSPEQHKKFSFESNLNKPSAKLRRSKFRSKSRYRNRSSELQHGKLLNRKSSSKTRQRKLSSAPHNRKRSSEVQHRKFISKSRLRNVCADPRPNEPRKTKLISHPQRCCTQRQSRSPVRSKTQRGPSARKDSSRPLHPVQLKQRNTLIHKGNSRAFSKVAKRRKMQCSPQRQRTNAVSQKMHTVASSGCPNTTRTITPSSATSVTRDQLSKRPSRARKPISASRPGSRCPSISRTPSVASVQGVGGSGVGGGGGGGGGEGDATEVENVVAGGGGDGGSEDRGDGESRSGSAKQGNATSKSRHASPYPLRPLLPPRKYICPLCNSSFPWLCHLKTHLLMHDQPIYRCTRCHFLAREPELLTEHMFTHTDEKPVTCDFCEAKFPSVRFLIRHINSEHGYPVEQE